MIYLWKLFIEWAMEYPDSALAIDISSGISIIVLIVLSLAVELKKRKKSGT
jgi:hypothetical protein